MQLTKAYVAEMSCSQFVVDSATYLLTISSPNIDTVATSLYDIKHYHIRTLPTGGLCQLQATKYCHLAFCS